MVMPAAMWNIPHEPNRRLPTARIEGGGSAAWAVLAATGPSAGAPASDASRPRAAGGSASSAAWRSDQPRGGSLITSLIASATSTPGRPTTMNAACQLRCSAIQPPAMAPNMVPSGMPKA